MNLGWIILLSILVAHCEASSPLELKQIFKFKKEGQDEVPVEHEENASENGMAETFLTDEHFELAAKLKENGQEDILHKTPEKLAQAMTKANKFEGDISNINKENVGEFVESMKTYFRKVGKGESVDTPTDENNRNAVRSKWHLWPKGRIPYSIASSFSKYSKTVIAAAMAGLQEKTCIKFVPKTSSDKDSIFIFSGQGCYSPAGKEGGRQELSLGNGCIDKGLIQHELIHAIGFYHEQSRTDRDQYVRVVLKNVQPGMEFNFDKYGAQFITDLGTKYDYTSLMHYGRKDFSVNGQDTLVPIKDPNAKIGQRRSPSANDIKKINLLYQCSGDTGETGTDSGEGETGGGDGAESEGGDDCTDTVARSLCRFWKSEGYCSHCRDCMKQKCAATCGFCDDNSAGGYKNKKKSWKTGGNRWKSSNASKSCTDAMPASACHAIKQNGLCNVGGNGHRCAKTCGRC